MSYILLAMIILSMLLFIAQGNTHEQETQILNINRTDNGYYNLELQGKAFDYLTEHELDSIMDQLVNERVD